MKESAGIIYKLEEGLDAGRYGFARHKDQLRSFSDFGKVFLRLYADPECEIPLKEPETGKQYVTLKHISTLTQIGFVD